MKNKINGKYHILRLINKKILYRKSQLKTMKIKIHAMRWLSFLIFLFISFGLLILFINGAETYIQSIIGYSITGFFTFFMGYFGWILARGIIDFIVKKENSKESSLAYHLKKENDYRY